MNSLVIVLFLSGMVAMIMLRTLHKDIARYNQMDNSVSRNAFEPFKNAFLFKVHVYVLLAHLRRRLIGELIVYRSSRRLCVRPCVRASVRALTLSNMNISETSWPIGMKFYLKHHWGGGKASVGFDPDQIRTLVSMATDSSHRVIMGKTASSRFLKCF